jgi:hypothetical protein
MTRLERFDAFCTDEREIQVELPKRLAAVES